METLKEIIKKIQTIKNFTIFAIILFLLIVVYFKNNRISKLEAKLEIKPQIEYIYQNTTDTFLDSIPVPVEVIKWKAGDPVRDTIYKPVDLTNLDSANIAKAYNDLYEKYAEITLYDNIFRDDSIAFIRLTEKTQYNKIFDRKLEFEDRTPIIKITNTVPEKTWSVVGGLSGNFENIYVGAGVVTKKNVVYTINYDPFNKGYSASFYLPVFNFKK